MVPGDPTLWNHYSCRDSHHTSLGLEAEARVASGNKFTKSSLKSLHKLKMYKTTKIPFLSHPTGTGERKGTGEGES